MNSEDGASQLGQQRKAKGGFLMLIILVTITIILISTSFHFYNLEYGEQTTVLSLTLKVTDGELDTVRDRYDPDTQTYFPYIKNISQDSVVKQESISAVESASDTELNLPGIVVRAYDAVGGQSVSYWTSIKYDGPGYYNLTLNFKEIPNAGDIIKIIIKIEDANADSLFPIFNDDLMNSSITYTWI